MSTESVTRQRGTHFTEFQLQAISAAIGSGRSQESIAQEFNCNRVTISRIAQRLRKATESLGASWKTAQISKAIEAVNAGLDCKDDPYKRMDGGIKVLTGQQVYKTADASTTLNIFYNTQDLPRDWYSQMKPIEESDAPVIDITPEESKG